MRRAGVAAGLVIVIASALAACLPSTRSGRIDSGSSPLCEASVPPLGALAPAVPAWCDPSGVAIDSAVVSGNSWSDAFNGGSAHGPLPTSYLVFENARRASAALTSVYRTQHVAHNGHWMVDIAGHGAPAGIYEASAADFFTGPNNGGALMRPNAGFRFEDGRLVVEFDVAAGMSAYGDRVWPEVVVTTAAAPTARETNGWYAAGLFGGQPAIACAFPSDRLSECRVYDADKITAYLNAHSSGGAASTFGGAPTAEPLRSAWHLCAPTDADTVCRDHFRVELTRDSVTIFVNGVRYMEHRGLPPTAQLPDELLRSPVYVYFGSWAYLVEPTIARIHWGRIAINPPALMR